MGRDSTLVTSRTSGARKKTRKPAAGVAPNKTVMKSWRRTSKRGTGAALDVRRAEARKKSMRRKANAGRPVRRQGKGDTA